MKHAILVAAMLIAMLLVFTGTLRGGATLPCAF